MKTRLIVLLMLLTTLITAQTMWDDALPIRQGTNIEWSRASATTDDGGIIYVWSDTKFGGRDIFAMKFDALGNSQWGEEPLTIDNKSDRQEEPVIIKTSDGNFVIAWIDYSLDSFDGDIFAQKVSNDGELLWQEGGVAVCTFEDYQISLNIVENGIGGAYISWKDYRGTSSNKIYVANLDDNGNNLWEADGKLIDGPSYGDNSYSMTEDGSGGFVLGYIKENMPNIGNAFAKRFNSIGESVWSEPIALSPTNGDQSQIKVSADGVGGFVFVWKDRRLVTSNILAQRLLSDGTINWGDYLEVYSDEDNAQSFPQNSPQIQADGLGNTIIVWEDNRNSLVNTGIYSQKIDSSGDLLWNEEGVEIRTEEVRQYTFRIDSDVNGGAFVIWTDVRNGDSPETDIYAQHIGADGTLLWSEDGLALSNANYSQDSSLIKNNGDNIFAVWLDSRSGSKGISQQVIDVSGNLVLEEDGETVFYGLSGNAGNDGLIEIYPRVSQNDAVILWKDDRTSFAGSKIFFQFLNPDGTVDLESNGRPVTTTIGYHQSEFSATTNDAGQTIVVWLEQRSNVLKVYGQLIDIDGTYLWGDEGMEMRTESFVGQEDPRVSYYNGDFYIGWSETLISDDWLILSQVFGQRISNGEKQWGENGFQISASLSGELDTEIALYDLIGNYYIWNVEASNRRVAKVNEAGEVVEGYSIDGNSFIPVDAYLGAGGQGAIHENTLYYSWVDDRDDYIGTVFTQGFADDGLFTWQEGIPTSLHQYDTVLNEALNPDMAIGDAVYVTWSESITSSNENIKAQKISFDGQHQFADEGVIIAEGDVSQTNSQIAKINDESYTIAWEQDSFINRDIYFNLLKSDGEVLSGTAGYPLVTAIKSQHSVKIAPIGNNQALFVWADGRSSGKETITGVYAQWVDFSAVSNEDNNDAQIVTSTLAQNYPNPFNPTTKISFNLAKDVNDVELTIYNLKGQKVKTLVKDDFSKGSYSYTWNGDNEQGRAVASGVYFYKLKAGKQTLTKKMVLMK